MIAIGLDVSSDLQWDGRRRWDPGFLQAGQLIPESSGGKIQEQAHFRGESATAGVQEMNREGRNLEAGQDRPQ